uniref:Uncharacterized protein n=1 Tax=Leersia perrieri TaxID=77586 RepID=A0A0D9XY36_9ORYZ
MKGGGGDKPGRSGVSPSLLRPMESKGSFSFRLLPVAAGCFLFFIVFLLSSSSHHNAIVLHTLRPRSSYVLHNLTDDGKLISTRMDPKFDLQRTPTYGNTAAEDAAAAGQDKSKSLQTALAVQTTSPRHKQPVDQLCQPLCDFSDPRTDFCDIAGDIRIDANATVSVVVDNPSGGVDVPTTYKLRPYARKGDVTAMGRVTQITVRTTTIANAAAAPRCTSTHAAPAVVFSAGGYAGNLFHDFTDLLIPLYNTAARYRREVYLVVSDADPRWLARYGAVLHGLSRHPPLHLAAGEVHCFRHAVVGLRAYGRGELVIDRDVSVDGLSTPDFTRFLRRALSLPRDAPTPRHAARPRLLIVSRRGTRLLLNADAVDKMWKVDQVA